MSASREIGVERVASEFIGLLVANERQPLV
jgi:hypothetical protein